MLRRWKLRRKTAGNRPPNAFHSGQHRSPHRQVRRGVSEESGWPNWHVGSNLTKVRPISTRAYRIRKFRPVRALPESFELEERNARRYRHLHPKAHDSLRAPGMNATGGNCRDEERTGLVPIFPAMNRSLTHMACTLLSAHRPERFSGVFKWRNAVSGNENIDIKSRLDASACGPFPKRPGKVIFRRNARRPPTAKCGAVSTKAGFPPPMGCPAGNGSLHAGTAARWLPKPRLFKSTWTSCVIEFKEMLIIGQCCRCQRWDWVLLRPSRRAEQPGNKQPKSQEPESSFDHQQRLGKFKTAFGRADD